jgi:hypothetical protein
MQKYSPLTSPLDRLRHARETDQAIQYCEESPDDEYPEIKWQFFGLVETNEIVTIARCGDFAVAASRPSPLLYPAMVDRIFGIDVSDYDVAMALSIEIWENHQQELLSALARQKN